MWWRLPRPQWTARKGGPNKEAFEGIVAAGPPPGILAYRGAAPVGWCAVAPRECYPTLQRSRTLHPIDDRPVWAVTCLFVTKEERHKGLSVALLEAAARFVRKQGGRIVEGYPVEPSKGKLPDAFAWTGTASAFRQAGFEECARRAARPIVRRTLNAGGAKIG
jgi:GNAT superfamily N-acetyltransferase